MYDNTNKGLALMINNRYFPKREKNRIRKGTNKDAEQLNLILKKLKYTVSIESNRTAQVYS
jgi:hypothetical protein